MYQWNTHVMTVYRYIMCATAALLVMCGAAFVGLVVRSKAVRATDVRAVLYTRSHWPIGQSVSVRVGPPPEWKPSADRTERIAVFVGEAGSTERQPDLWLPLNPVGLVGSVPANPDRFGDFGAGASLPMLDLGIAAPGPQRARVEFRLMRGSVTAATRLEYAEFIGVHDLTGIFDAAAGGEYDRMLADADVVIASASGVLLGDITMYGKPHEFIALGIECQLMEGEAVIATGTWRGLLGPYTRARFAFDDASASVLRSDRVRTLRISGSRDLAMGVFAAKRYWSGTVDVPVRYDRNN